MVTVAILARRDEAPVYETGKAQVRPLPTATYNCGHSGVVASAEFAQFRKKAETFLNDHLGEAAVAKVRSGQPLTADDLDELQRILVAAGIGDQGTFAEASELAGSFGLFIRSLVGLDRAAAKAAFAEFLDDKRYSKNQIQFVNLIIDELTDRGVVEASRV